MYKKKIKNKGQYNATLSRQRTLATISAWPEDQLETVNSFNVYTWVRFRPVFVIWMLSKVNILQNIDKPYYHLPHP